MNQIENDKLVTALDRLIRLYDQGNLVLEHYDDLDQAQAVQDAIYNARTLLQAAGRDGDRSARYRVEATHPPKTVRFGSIGDRGQQRVGASSGVPARQPVADLLPLRPAAHEKTADCVLAERS